MAKKSKSKSTPPATKASSSLLDFDPVAEPVFAEGNLRPYLVTAVPESVTQKRAVTRREWPLIGALLVVGSYVRFRNIGIPNSVVFDEVHFGGFAKKYVLGKFFMDVHPPLAKMLFAAVSSLGGFDGSFDFANIGDAYPANVPYLLMRYFAAGLGLATVLLCYLTLRSSGVRPVVAFITTACLLIENSFVTISKYILLDSPLVFFIASAIYAFKKFEVQQPFTLAWYRALLSCSISLGLAFSSKWVGLFTIAWVGVLCVVHLWLLIGDLQVKSSAIWKNTIARASFLLGIPLVLYLAFFAVHFNILSNDGDGSAFMSSAFKAGLNGATIPHTTSGPVGFGSVVSIRHVNTRGGYLHSHKHFYPAGSKQQQITLYPHVDTNNDWLIEPYNQSIPEHFTQIKNGDKIRLKHVRTSLRLHSHDEKPPVSDRDWQKEVSGYGFEGFGGDANDDWIVEIVPHKTPENARGELRAIESVFRLRHAMSGHYLFSSDVKLPKEWGFDQQEVTSASQGARALTHWYIETNTNDKLQTKDDVSYPKLSLLQKFLESHKVMWNINNGLTSHHNWQSEPHEWPVLLRGINYWNKNHTQVYFIGNPVVWWTTSACLVGFIVHVAINIIKWQAGSNLNVKKAAFQLQLPNVHLLCWMGHSLLSIFHHGKPAYIFLVAFLAASTVAYSTLSPLIAGTPWTKGKCLRAKLVSSWDFDCNTFFETPKEYEDFLLAPVTEEAKTVTTSVVNQAQETPLVVDLEERVLAASDNAHEEPPAAETHTGEWPFGDKVLPEEIPHGELFDEATVGKEENIAQEVNIAETVDEPILQEEAVLAPEPEIKEQEEPIAVAEPEIKEQEEPAPVAESVPEFHAPEEPVAPVEPEFVAQAEPAPEAAPEPEIKAQVALEHEQPEHVAN
ncbi:hypothetical protein JCM33374_g2577 [Metschnikowia sp. JCM 33374]|nr:hypothetical protein JCM33374_g2577 [Metschnikowia sp. JCM 33374]